MLLFLFYIVFNKKSYLTFCVQKLYYLCITKKEKTMEDEIFEMDTPELGDELSYSFAFQQIQTQIIKSWKNLKKYLSSESLSDEAIEEINTFDKLLNYFY